MKDLPDDGLTDSDRAIIHSVLRVYPQVERAVLFGSRAMGTFSRGSDIDLALEGEQIDQGVISRIAGDLETSRLPFKVDLLHRDAALSAAVERHIRAYGREFYQCKWRVVRFRDILTTGVRNGIYKPKNFHGRGTKIVNMGELFKHSRMRAIPMRRVEVNDSELERFGLNEQDLLFARRSLVAEGAGKCSIVLNIDEPTVFESSIIRARPNTKQANPLFLYYFWSSFSGTHLLDTIRRHVAVAGITGKDLEALEIPLPPTDEQNAIADVLGALDDKIEQNRRTSRALEELARAIFRAWFVDFEPVKAKAAGATAFPSMPQDTFDALPDSFVDSEVGPIPKNWQVTTFGNLLDLKYGKALKAEDRSTGPYPVFGSNGQVGWHDEALVPGSGIVVGRKGNPGTVRWVATPFFPIDTTFFVVPKPNAPPLEVLYYLLDWTQLARLSADSAVPGLNRNFAYSETCLLPQDFVLSSFVRTITSLRGLVHALDCEMRKLADLRDYLLPRLLSGQVRVEVRHG